MPTILYVAMTVVLLNVMTSLYISKTNDYKEKKYDFDKEQLIDNNKNIEKSILSFYNNHYGEIHQNYNPSQLIQTFSNSNGYLNKFYLFNNNKLCIYTDPRIDAYGNETTSTEPKKILTTEQEIQSNEFNKNMDCETTDLKTFISTLPIDNINEQKIIEDFGKLVDTNYFLRIDIESIKDFKTIRLPVLNIYMYKSTKRQKPDLSTEIRLNTDLIVSNKIDEAKFVLDSISNMLNEYGKRNFKGFTKLNTYSNFNSFSNLAEGYILETSTGEKYHGIVSINSSSGFQTSSLMAFHTRYFNDNTKSEIDKIINDKWRDNSKNKIECDYVDSTFNKNVSLEWYSDNSYYSCEITQTNSLTLTETIKPEGYCSLSDICTLNYTFDDYGKIKNINSYTLKDFLISDTGMSFDITKYKNPFFPNELIEENDNFILSSSNGNKGLDSGISLNIGLKIINRPFDGNPTMLFNEIDLEGNYLINKYFISY